MTSTETTEPRPTWWSCAATLLAPDEAVAMAAQMTADDASDDGWPSETDGWTYTATRRGASAVIRVYDADGEFLGHV